MQTGLDNPLRFFVTLPTGDVQWELIQAHERRVSLVHNNIPQASFVISSEHPAANSVLNDDLLLKVYRGANLIFHGPIVSAEETAGDQGSTIQANAAGVWWRAGRRLILGSRTDAGYSINTSFTNFDVTVAQPLIDIVNNEFFTGIAY